MLRAASRIPHPASRFTFHVSRFTLHVSRSTFHAPRPTPHAPRPTHHSGVALVVTLVLLSVITFMAVTFLVVSQSQQGAVATDTDQAIARLAADTARERAIVQLLAPILTWTNELNYGLLVSTNYINSDGFDQTLAAPGPVNPTNVNYDYTRAGAALNPNQRLQNLANLLYDPRPPVFIVTNALAANSNDFRFYLDLNRNGRYDTNGFLPVINPQGGFYDTNGNPYPPPIKLGNALSNFFVGDPEWIGGLQRPEFAHSATNLFTHRYAYLVVPAGQTLDLNTIHNYVKRNLASTKPSEAWRDGFLRDQGVLTAEINLAAFLVDLNTNLWPFPLQPPAPFNFRPYSYNPFTPTENPYPGVNTGSAFDDAASFMRYRYATNVNSLANVKSLFGFPRANAFTNLIDCYSEGPLMTGTWWPPPGVVGNPNQTAVNGNYPWASADNPNHFYTTQDLFDTNKLSLPTPGYYFPDRLRMAGTNTDSYNRYTFYRLLSQLGTDSDPEPGGKMNLNYCNVDNNGYVVRGMETNFIPWTPVQFFTNAAIRLLADAGYTVGATNSTSNLLATNVVGGYLVTNLHIPIWPANSNLYTPSVHHLLQLAANMYDATTNRFSSPLATNGFPSVFCPLFNDQRRGPKGGLSGGSVFIIGYIEPNSAQMSSLLNAYPLPHDLSDPNDTRLPNPNANLNPMPMVYGIPLVIGAKKGYPNFNEFAMQMLVQVTRKLQYHRDPATTNINEIDQMFIVGVSNVFGVEAWNSYSNAFPRLLQMVVYPDINVMVTNLETHIQLIPPPTRYQPPVTGTPQFITVNNWQGYVPVYPTNSFVTPLTDGYNPYTNHLFLTNSTYRRTLDQFVQLATVFERTPGSTNLHVPQWQLQLKTRLRFALFDPSAGRSAGRIVDYVNLAADYATNLTLALMAGSQGCGSFWTPDGSYGSMWCTNRQNGATNDSNPTFGILNQIQASLGQNLPNLTWNSGNNDFPPGMGKADAITFFQGQFLPPGYYSMTSNTFNAPYQPSRSMYIVTSWQANDPLVHYTVGDLPPDPTLPSNPAFDNPPTPLPLPNLGAVNNCYRPWGGNPSGSSSDPQQFDMAVKDPLVESSDNWDFPTGKLPNVGWLGRVHRGTPWQTVYLKPSPNNFPPWLQPLSPFDLPTWTNWTGNGLFVANIGQFSTNVMPLYSVAYDAYFTQPTNDWRLLDLFTTALNDNATRGQLSINQTNLAAWSAVLSGVIVLTNTVDVNGNPVLSPQVIEPAGVYDPFDPTNWPPLVQLVKRINDIRATNTTRGVFSHLSDLLAVPELTVASPFLNTSISPLLAKGGPNPSYVLNDAAIERLPQQILGLLKCDHTPRFVIYAFGQTLKPAPNSKVNSSGPFFGLCTNYQIMAEAATRTVVRFEGVQPYLGSAPPWAITTLHPVIESFNVLPPD
jgi:hypothetical protein